MTVETDGKLLRDAIAKPTLSEETREAFQDMLEKLDANHRELSEKQRAWVKSALGDDLEPEYENLVSAGKVPRGKEVETIPALRRENLPLKPPGRK